MNSSFASALAAFGLAAMLTLSHGLLRSAVDFVVWSVPWMFRIGLALVLYGVIFAFYTYLLKKIHLSNLYPLYTALSILGVSLVGIVYFGEPLTSIKMLGILVLLTGVILISI